MYPRDHRPMHVLVSRGGQLVAVVGPICDDPDCTGCSGFTALDDRQHVEAATVADREDVTLEHLRAAAADFLQRAGWTDVDPEVCAGLALYMAMEAAEIAQAYPVGTRLHADYDRATDVWAFTRA
jgi:hypothetical protein